MKMIDNILEHLNEEVDGAITYAEKYVEAKANGNMARANRYKEMANDELKHASFLREMSATDVQELKKVYKMTDDEQGRWDHGHNQLTERMALVMHILSM